MSKGNVPPQKQRKFICKQCQKVFLTKIGRRNHMKLKHQTTTESQEPIRTSVYDLIINRLNINQHYPILVNCLRRKIEKGIQRSHLVYLKNHIKLFINAIIIIVIIKIKKLKKKII